MNLYHDNHNAILIINAMIMLIKLLLWGYHAVGISNHTQKSQLNHLLVFTVCFLPHHNLLHPYRSLILACPVILMEVSTTPLREAVFRFAGRLQRPFSTGSTPQRVMCGAMGWWCMRYGHWDTSRLRSSQWKRYVCNFIFVVTDWW